MVTLEDVEDSVRRLYNLASTSNSSLADFVRCKEQVFGNIMQLVEQARDEERQKVIWTLEATVASFRASQSPSVSAVKRPLAKSSLV